MAGIMIGKDLSFLALAEVDSKQTGENFAGRFQRSRLENADWDLPGARAYFENLRMVTSDKD